MGWKGTKKGFVVVGERTVDVDLVTGDGRALAVNCRYDFGLEVLRFVSGHTYAGICSSKRHGGAMSSDVRRC